MMSVVGTVVVDTTDDVCIDADSGKGLACFASHQPPATPMAKQETPMMG